MDKKLLIFNWKMNLPILSEWNKAIKSSTPLFYKKRRGDIVVCPPFTHLEKVSKLIKNTKIKLGAQDVFYESKGSFTGEISATELKNLGVKYVIIGHSERRQFLGETDKIINKKVLAALKAGLKVILCVGEPKRDIKRHKKYDLRNAKNYIKKQLEKDLKGILNLKSYGLNLIIAYEPVWAIGTGKNDTPEDAAEIVKFIKKSLKLKTKNLKPMVLYGGSVNSKNIEDFAKYKKINGFLIGSASLKTKEIKNIIKAI